MKIIDKYILKRYLVTFAVMLVMFIPIGITIDVSEKVNKMIEKKIPLKDILIYYGDFTILPICYFLFSCFCPSFGSRLSWPIIPKSSLF
jgi:lipopolysaccharide export LptBFGC system permease protein LptF